MKYQESEIIELKERVIDDLKKEIIAFANCSGGKVFVGVQDDGTAVGVDNPDEVALQISNMVRDSIKPDLTMFVHYETIVEEDKNIICVHVQRGTDRPYYISKKGMHSGVYVRQGYSSVQATDLAVRQMIKEADGDSFEAMRSLHQDLSFDECKKVFELHDLNFENNQMRSLGILDSDGLYTNLGLLLSDQCVHSIKVAVFQGRDQMVFKNRKEFNGSLLKQMNDVYDFIDFHNHTHSTIDKLYRIDKKDFPEVALREALLNVLVHRDYGFSASSFINIYEDRIEFVSIGGIVSGLDLDDILFGISDCRNNKLANIFYRLHLIEAYGTGISKIMNSYKDSLKTPKIETTKNAFKITLPNLNIKYQNVSKIQEEPYCYDINENKVLDYTYTYGQITRAEVEKILEVSESTATRLIRKMVKNGTLKKKGNARSICYVIE